MKVLAILGFLWLAACTHTEESTHTMSWSQEPLVGMHNRLLQGSVRFTFIDAPKFHVGLNIPGLAEHLKASGKNVVPVHFKIQCKQRHFALIRVLSVDGLPVQSNAANMWMESANVVPGKDAGPFPGACQY
jgi:hypothetical protein